MHVIFDFRLALGSVWGGLGGDFSSYFQGCAYVHVIFYFSKVIFILENLFSDAHSLP